MLEVIWRNPERPQSSRPVVNKKEEDGARRSYLVNGCVWTLIIGGSSASSCQQEMEQLRQVVDLALKSAEAQAGQSYLGDSKFRSRCRRSYFFSPIWARATFIRLR